MTLSAVPRASLTAGSSSASVSLPLTPPGLCSCSCLTRNSLRLCAEHPLRARPSSGHQKHRAGFAGPLPSSPTSAHQISSTPQACLRCPFVWSPRPPASTVPGSLAESQAPAQTCWVSRMPGVLSAHPSLSARAGLCCCNEQPPVATGPRRLTVVVTVILTASDLTESFSFLKQRWCPLCKKRY